jgi:pilus assembly protein CpaB
MNITRIAILGVAAIAAGAAALLVRGMLGGGTPEASATPSRNLATVEILVAAKPIEPGRRLEQENVRWEAWPKDAIGTSFLSKETHPDLAKAIEGAVARAPLVEGEPITEAKFVRAESASFMSATLTPGNRAISIPVSAETGAGGFILPNDRVDIIMTQEVDLGGVKAAQSKTILRDVRVLAIDQALKQEGDQAAVVGKTATLEVAPSEAELVAQAEALGKLSVSLRALGEDVELVDTAASAPEKPTANTVTIIRYGVASKTRTGNTTTAKPE